MHWFYVENSQIGENSIRITGSDVNHIKNVLRMEKGERIVICNGEGTDYFCEIETIEADHIVAKIMEMNDTQSELQTKIYLFQGLPKKDKMELIIQKTVELGVFEIIPVAMKRCVTKIEDKKKEQKKLERWQAIATAAAKQSGRGRIPKIHKVLNFDEAIAYAKELEYGLVPYELAEGMKQSHAQINEACKHKSIAVFIGPEGGFDENEIEKVLSAGLHPISLGKRILRTETAGLTTVSILMYELEVQEDTAD